MLKAFVHNMKYKEPFFILWTEGKNTGINDKKDTIAL